MSDALFYTTLEKTGHGEYSEKRSEFLAVASPVKTEDEAAEIIKQEKKRYPDARHHVWAYLLGGEITARYSDDGEPQGTAGVPILEVLRKSGATDAVVVVTRYFGGILLGAGGLARAYSHAAKAALDDAHIITYERYAEMTLDCSYSDFQRYQVELPRFGAVVDEIAYTDRVRIRFAVKDAVCPALCERIAELGGGKDTPVLCGHRFDYR